ncbi:MAG: hypothetical protein IM540_05500 [Chitinophagaceae bacterium]|nr:hypothetical protein [Chitinophagaceae bacterium]
MRYLFTWIACCLALTVFSAAPLEKNRWHDFEGLVADKATHLSVYMEDNGKIVGSFCYAGKKPEHTVQGLMEGERLQLSIMNGQKIVARFDARMTSSDADRMEGDWNNVETNDVFIVKLTYIASCGGDAKHRYTSIDLPDTVAEAFMQTAVTKILAKDKQWVVNHTFYPLETSLLGKKGITIRNAAQLLSLYDKVFYPAYLSRLRSVCFCGLFHNYRGLMVGRGELWIGQLPAGVGKTPRLVINGVVN